MNSVQKEMIRLYAKQLRLPTFNNYEKVIRQLSVDDGYAQFLIEPDETGALQNVQQRVRNAG